MNIRYFSNEFSSKIMHGLELLKLIVTRWSADVICIILRLLRQLWLVHRYGYNKLGQTQNI